MKRRPIAALVVLVVAFLVWRVVRERLSVEAVIETEALLRGFIEAHPWRAFALGFGAYVVVSVFPGTSGKSVVVGWLFGFWQALLMVTVALTIAGVFGFSVARYLLRDALRDRFRLRLETFDRAVQREGVFYLLTVRLLHVPFTLVNYASGLIDIPIRTFAWTTLVGLVPSTMVFVGLGAGLPSLDELRDRGAASLVSPAVVIALIAMGLIPWLLRWGVRKFLPAGPEAERVDRGATGRGRSQ
jgi:uncharacterized membrane protein YdjX (TVP38/TMEM64 family)